MTRQPRAGAAWENLARLLVHRRVQLDPRYRNRRAFCHDKQLDYRVISDIEGARRTNFSAPMLTAIEVAYELAAGAIQQALDNPDITELPARDKTQAACTDRDRPPADVPDTVRLQELEPWERHIWLTPTLTADQRRGLIRFARLQRGELTDDLASLLQLSDALSQVIARHLREHNGPSRAG